MLIRLASGDLVEYPDEVGALALADPSQGNVPDYSLEELNLLISILLGMLFDESLTLEQNIEQAKEHFTKWGSPTEGNMQKAIDHIARYKENVEPANVGYSDVELIKDVFCIPNRNSKFDDNVIENMPTTPKKLIGHSDTSEKTAQKFDENS